MIVMKFGGSSLESPEAVRRICAIVHSHHHRTPVIVVSAIGKTTDRLAEMAAEAAKGHGFAARQLLSQLQDVHFDFASELLDASRLQTTEQSFRKLFRELYGFIHDLSQEGCLLTPEISDSILSFGERLSSELIAAALLESGLAAQHVDARAFLITDTRFGEAAPHYWETFARIRRAFPLMLRDSTPVLGGFIAAAEDGRTTTLGRGGSDYTASLIGAALNADEIQIWTDVDGMLTCDPRVYSGGYRLRQISYQEASAMAFAGAKVLHPQTVLPAVRQRIPLVIRNSRRPHIPGTRIVPAVAECDNPVKGLAVMQNLLLLAIRGGEDANSATTSATLQDFFNRKNLGAAFVKPHNGLVYVGFPSTLRLDQIETELNGCILGCIQGQALTNYCLVTLIGCGIGGNRFIADKAAAVCKGISMIDLNGGQPGASLSFAVPQQHCRQACELLHQEFFSKVDPDNFAPVPTPRESYQAQDNSSLIPGMPRAATYVPRKTQTLSPART